MKLTYISAAEINITRNSLQDWLSVPGNYIYHQLIPTSISIAEMRSVSNNDEFELYFMCDRVSMNCMKVMKYQVAKFPLSKYDDQHWVGVVSEVNEEEHDVKIKFCIQIILVFSLNGQFLMTFPGFQKQQQQLIIRLETPIASSVPARE